MTEVAAGKPELIHTHVLVDSAKCHDHTTNPHDYTQHLEQTLYHVQSVHLRDLFLKTTPVFAIVRASQWIDAGQDTIASQVTTTQASFDAGGFTEHVQIYTNDGLVDLAVHYCFNERETRANGDYRDFSCFICTGTVNTSSTDLWYFTDPDTVLIMTDALGGTADTAATPGSPAGNSSISVTRMRTQAFLRLTIGHTVLDRQVFDKAPAAERWRSYWIYEAGDIVQIADGTLYRCTKTHLSLIFTTDQATNGYWVVTTAADTPRYPTQTFHTVESIEDNEAYVSLKCKVNDISWFNTEHVSLHASAIRVEWINRWNRAYRFTANGNLEVTSFQSSPYATSVREFERHWLTLEVQHYAQGLRGF